MRRGKVESGKDLRERPMYSLAEAAHYLHVPAATLRGLIEGRQYRSGGELRFSEGLVRRPDPRDGRLSFNNLVELHVLRPSGPSTASPCSTSGRP